MIHIGVDVGGTFTDLVAWDGAELRIIKHSSTPPEFQKAVVEAVGRVIGSHELASIVHGSTVATNALLQRAGEPVAFITTEGFRDMLLIGRQNRPRLYALNPQRPAPIVMRENCYTVRERIGADGSVVDPLDEADVARVIDQIRASDVRHVAVCLLFSFVNPSHEQTVARRCREAGLTVSLSSDILPEFREYERASTTAINAALRPTVERYLAKLQDALPRGRPERTRVGRHSPAHPSLKIIHSSGGTLDASSASEQAVRLVLSGPAGGVIGAAHCAKLAGFANVITYDMGGTSTDVATIVNGRPRWTTQMQIDGLPIGLPMLDIHTIGAGGGSIAWLDPGGALRVGPKSAGAAPGPACYGRGGHRPTVTDANVVLGRLPRDATLADEMTLDFDAAHRAVESLAKQINKTVTETALGVIRVAESNMAGAVRAVTSRRGFDPREFSLVSFGGAGGLHACAIAEQLDIPRVIVPPYSGVLSALGMVVAPPVSDVSRTVLHAGDSFDIPAEFALLDSPGRGTIERFADVRFAGQSHELTVSVNEPTRESIAATFIREYERVYGRVPRGRAIEIVTLRVRRTGQSVDLRLPDIMAMDAPAGTHCVIDYEGSSTETMAIGRGQLVGRTMHGPLLILDTHATCFVPSGWRTSAHGDGTVLVTREDS